MIKKQKPTVLTNCYEHLDKSNLLFNNNRVDINDLGNVSIDKGLKAGPLSANIWKIAL